MKLGCVLLLGICQRGKWKPYGALEHVIGSVVGRGKDCTSCFYTPLTCSSGWAAFCPHSENRESKRVGRKNKTTRRESCGERKARQNTSSITKWSNSEFMCCFVFLQCFPLKEDNHINTEWKSIWIWSFHSLFLNCYIPYIARGYVSAWSQPGSI